MPAINVGKLPKQTVNSLKHKVMKRIILIIQLLIPGTVIPFGRFSSENTYKADLRLFQLKNGAFKFNKFD